MPDGVKNAHTRNDQQQITQLRNQIQLFHPRIQNLLPIKHLINEQSS